MAYQPSKTLAMAHVIRWVIQTLVRMAQRHDWGEIKIVVQDGQIVIATEQTSFRSALPRVDPNAVPAVVEVGRQLVSVGNS